MNIFSHASIAIETLLKETGDFLSLTRQYPQCLPCESFSFNVEHLASNTTSRVTVVDTGIILFEPLDRPSRMDIVLSSAIHGNETAPIEICNEMISELLCGELKLSERVLFIFGNPPAINIDKRFVEENMNRLFSGAHSLDQGQGAGLINQERHRALILENTLRDFFLKISVSDKTTGISRERYHYDLHTAIRGSKCDKFAVYPFKHDQAYNKRQLAFLLACGVNAILFANEATTTFSYFSSDEFNAESFTVELGKVRPFGENDMTQFINIRNTLTKLISGQQILLKPYQNDDFQLYQISQVINKHHEEFSFTFADNVENFTTFNADDVLAIDGDIIVKAQQDGEAIIFPNVEVAIGQRALLTVIPKLL